MLWNSTNRIICRSFDFQQEKSIEREEQNPLNVGKSILRTSTLTIGFLQVAMMYKISVSILHLKGQITFTTKEKRKRAFFIFLSILLVIYDTLEICTYAVDWWTIGNANYMHAGMLTALFLIYLGTLINTNQKISLLG